MYRDGLLCMLGRQYRTLKSLGARLAIGPFPSTLQAVCLLHHPMARQSPCSSRRNCISAEAIAAKLGDSLRQQFHQTGLPAVAEAIGVQAAALRHASKEPSAALDDFANPNRRRSARQRRTTFDEIESAECWRSHSRPDGQAGKELPRTVAVLCVRRTRNWVCRWAFFTIAGSPAPVSAKEQPAASVQGLATAVSRHSGRRGHSHAIGEAVEEAEIWTP